MWWTPLLNVLEKVIALVGPSFFSSFNIMGVFDNVKKYWHAYLVAVVLVLLSASSWGWFNDHNLLLKERDAHQQDLENIKTAQQTALEKAKDKKDFLDKEAKINADQADVRYSALLAKYRSNLVRLQASQGSVVRSDSGDDAPAQGGNGSSTGSQVPSVIISDDDAQICLVNTARLQAVHDWALENGDK